MKSLLAAFFVLAFVIAPAFGQKIVSQIAAKVNKDIILASEVKKAEEEARSEFAESKLKGSQLQQAIDERMKNVLRDLIDKYLVLQEASDLGMDANLEVLKQIEALRVQYNFKNLEELEAAMAKQGTSIEDVKDSIRYKNLRSQVFHREVTGKIVITTEEMRKYYEAHKQDFDRPPGVSIGMIAVATDGLSATEAQEKRKTMDDALAAIKKGEDFEDTAHKYSEDPSAADGGAIGFFEKMPDGTYGLASPEMETVVAKLTKGQTTDVLSNPQNKTLIILKLLDRHDGGILPFELAQMEIYSMLLDERAEPRVREFLTKLRAEGFVEVTTGFTDTGASTKAVRAADTALPRESKD